MSAVTRRQFLAAAIAGASLPRGLHAAASQDIYFAGCFHDTALGPDSQMYRYLIAPLGGRPAGSGASAGAETTPLVLSVLRGRGMTLGGSPISLDPGRGNPLVLLVSRAQHEMLQVSTPGLADEHLTVISVTVSLDIMTDRAAAMNSNRFESLYSTMVAMNKPVHRRMPIPERELPEQYRHVLEAGIEELLQRAQHDLADRRERAAAVFQIKTMAFPATMPGELAQLIEAGMVSDGVAGADGTAMEVRRLSRELQFMLNFTLSDVLARRGRHDLALIPPASPWTEGRVLRQLQQRLGYGAEILHTPEPNRMNGYDIRAGVPAMSTAMIQDQRTRRLMQLNAQMAARIVRPRGDGTLLHVPSAVASAREKTAIGFGNRTFHDVPGIQRRATRDLAMGSLRDAARETAERLVDLMALTAAEVN